VNWIIVNSNEDLNKLNDAVCWADSETIEYYGTIRNEAFFPNDVSRSGQINKNVHVLCRACSAHGRYLEMVLIDCDLLGSRYLDQPYMSGRVDNLKRVYIENAEGSTVMRCSRLIYRFLLDESVNEGQFYSPGAAL
jgi:hypothetical protein